MVPHALDVWEGKALPAELPAWSAVAYGPFGLLDQLNINYTKLNSKMIDIGLDNKKFNKNLALFLILVLALALRT